MLLYVTPCNANDTTSSSDVCLKTCFGWLCSCAALHHTLHHTSRSLYDDALS